MQTYKSLEKKPKVFGIPIMEFFLSIAVGMLFFVFANIIGIPALFVTFFTLVIIIGALIVLRYGNKTGNPTFLQSMIANKTQKKALYVDKGTKFFRNFSEREN